MSTPLPPGYHGPVHVVTHGGWVGGGGGGGFGGGGGAGGGF